MRQKITLTNKFHDTTAIVKAKDGLITESQYRRAEQKLCGINDCRCRKITTPYIQEVTGGYEIPMFAN